MIRNARSRPRAAAKLFRDNDRLLRAIGDFNGGQVQMARDMFRIGAMRQGTYYQIRRLAFADVCKKKI